MASDFPFELAWRLVLGISTIAPDRSADTRVIQGSDISPLARLLERQLGEIPGSRGVRIYP
jgi:hypothetical protein